MIRPQPTRDSSLPIDSLWRPRLFGTGVWLAVLAALSGLQEVRGISPLVPGTGQLITLVGDDFEDPNWSYDYRHPKSSRNIDEQERGPLGESANKRWLEGPHRGTPDLLRRVPTPDGGLPGSDGALLIRTLRSGIPNQVTYQNQQDDIMVKVKQRLGQAVPASAMPSCVVRVHVPEFEYWENRSGASFGFRTDVWGKKPGEKKLEQYWPGIFINFRSETTAGVAKDSAYLSVRANKRGQDLRGPEIVPGWYTLGMSVTPDGMCHFYARQGIENLTAQDHLGSHYCYGFRAERFDLFFFNVLTFDNGKTWSTPWIIDDPQFFCVRPVRVAGQPNRSFRR